MSGDLIALVVGTLLGVGALAFVLYPLFFDQRIAPRRVRELDRAREDSPIVALREIEFDRATGKLSDADYAELRATYAGRALSELRQGSEGEGASPAASVDPIEARVRAFRATHRECATCGLRPESDAIYCSSCGAFLDRVCPLCSAAINEPGATFCSSCGVALQRARADGLSRSFLERG